MKKFFFITIIAAVIISAFIAYGSKHDLSKQAPVKNEEVNNPVTNVGQKSVADDSENDSSSVANPTPYGKPDKDEKPRDRLKNIPLKELAGPVHNEYGIRDDIYNYIQKTIQPNNKMAMKAAITYASTSQFIYYKATEEEALKAVRKSLIALDCLSEFESDSEISSLTKKISKLMRNTPERESRIRYIDKRYFGWKIFGVELTSEEIKKLCETGEY